MRSLSWVVGRDGARDGADASAFRILMYHRVSDEKDPLSVGVSRFRAQMGELAAQGFRAVDVVEACRQLRGAAPESGEPRDGRRLIGLSFDDGYHDVAEHALPVLEELGFSATVFVVTGAVGGRVRLSWYERQPELLNWKEIEELDSASPLRFEAHSESHPNLVALPEEDARVELAQSKLTLEDHVQRPVRTFCYPGGVFTDRERRLARDVGYELAVSCDPGVNHRDSDPLALRRLPVEPGDRLFDFEAKVRGGHDSELPLRATYRRLRYRGTAQGDRAPRQLPTRGFIGRLHH